MSLKKQLIRVGLLLLLVGWLCFEGAALLGFSDIVLIVYGGLAFVFFFGCGLIVLFRRSWDTSTELERFGSDFVIYGYGVWISLLVSNALGHSILPWAGDLKMIVMIFFFAILLLAYWRTLYLSESIREVARQIDKDKFDAGIEDIGGAFDVLERSKGREYFARSFFIGFIVAVGMTVADLIPG